MVLVRVADDPVPVVKLVIIDAAEEDVALLSNKQYMSYHPHPPSIDSYSLFFLPSLKKCLFFGACSVWAWLV